MNTSLLRCLLPLVVGLMLAAAPLAAQDSAAASDAILGQWLTAEGTSKIEIYKSGEEFCGRIAWLKEPERDGKARVDDKNPDEKLRDRPLQGLIILRGFTYDGEGVWAGGEIYDPKSGNDYKAKMTLVDAKTLDLRGYVLIPLFGRTERWTR